VLVEDFTSAAIEIFDAVWVNNPSEECMLNPHSFFKRLFAMLREGGILALAVPSIATFVGRAPTSLWVGGLIIQHLVLAGFDCRHLRLFKRSNYIGILLKKRSIQVDISHGLGEDRLCALLRSNAPQVLKLASEAGGACELFEGSILSMNW